MNYESDYGEPNFQPETSIYNPPNTLKMMHNNSRQRKSTDKTMSKIEMGSARSSISVF